MKTIRKYLLLTQIYSFVTSSVLLNIALISYLIFGFVGIGAILLPSIIIARIIEEKLGYSYYLEELMKEGQELPSPKRRKVTR